MYVHCPQETTIKHIEGNGFIRTKNKCVFKTETKILQNVRSGIEINTTFQYIPENNITFDMSEISILKESLAKNHKQNYSNSLNVDFDQLVKNMDHKEFKRRMLSFQDAYDSDTFMQKYVLNPTILAVFMSLILAFLLLCFKIHKAQTVNSGAT